MHPLAARRILRLALGTALSLCISQIFSWPLSFIAPLFVLLILALPLPAPNLKSSLRFLAALLVPIIAALALVPFLLHARWTGILLLTLALYYSFYFTARGGSAALGNFMTIGLTLVVTIGSVNSSVLIALVQALALNAALAMAFVWLAHALLPDLPSDPSVSSPKPAAPPKPGLPEARRKALRSLLIVLPIALLFLFMSGSPSYSAVMIKVSSMGQQASTDESREMGRSLLTSTFWGGAGAILCWHLLSAWPSLILYTLLIALAGLQFGRRIFRGTAMSPDFSKWSYAFMTMLVILAPAVVDSPASSSADAAFWSRLGLFVLIAFYGTFAVAVFDAFRPGSRRRATASA